MHLARPARGTISTMSDDAPSAQLADEAELVARARLDPLAFAPIYERYYTPIHLYCRRRLGHPEEAADATALVFTRAIAAIDRFQPDPAKPGSTVRAWLFTIARHIVLDRYRRDRPHLSLDDPDRTWHLPDGRESPEDLAIAGDESRSVAALLARLPERQRAVVELRLAGLTIAEICAALDLTESAAKSLQVRAYRTLRDLVGRDATPITREHNR